MKNNTKLLQLLDRAVNAGWGNRVMILGDFNYRDIDYNRHLVKTGMDTEAGKFFQKSQDLYLFQNVSDDTRIREGQRASIIDYIFTDEDMLVDNLQYEAPLAKSDHVCMVWDYIMDVAEIEGRNVKLDFWKGHYNQINQELEAIDWEELLLDCTVDSAWEIFRSKLNHSVKKNVPVRKASAKKRKNPWLTKATKRAISKRDKAWRKYRDCRTEENLQDYKRLRNSAGRKVKADQASYRKRILKSFKGHPKRFYGYMRKLKTVKEKVGQIKKVNGEFTASDVETAQALGDYFSSVFIEEGEYMQSSSDNVNSACLSHIDIDREDVMKRLLKLQMDKALGPDDIRPAVLTNCARTLSLPLTLIYRKSLQEGKLPSDWKLANVIPIYKKGSKTEAGNYRPISLTSVPCKLLESIIKDAVVNHLETVGFYNHNQHGFVRGRSTLTNLLETLESWTRILEEGYGLDVIYLDYRKAFDSVPHKRLIDKVKGMGVNGSLLRWLEQFLLDRKMRVQINENVSDWFRVLSGVPQGSVLGPLLFLIYVQDLPQWVTNSIMMFADDTKLWAKISRQEDGATLQR